MSVLSLLLAATRREMTVYDMYEHVAERCLMAVKAEERYTHC